VRRAIAIESGQVHERIVENVRDDRGERLPAVDMCKAIVAGKSRRREPDNAADSRENLSHGASRFEGFECFGRTAAPEMNFPRDRNDKSAG